MPGTRNPRILPATPPIPDWLVQLGIPLECIEYKSSAEELRSSFSIVKRPDEAVWRIKVDGGWITSQDEAKVDYLFWTQSASGQKRIILVELKGVDYRHAMRQIDSTLRRLCKTGIGTRANLVHNGRHIGSPGHDLTSAGAVRAFIVLSNGRAIGRSRQLSQEIFDRYRVLVIAKEHISISELDRLVIN